MAENKRRLGARLTAAIITVGILAAGFVALYYSNSIATVEVRPAPTAQLGNLQPPSKLGVSLKPK